MPLGVAPTRQQLRAWQGHPAAAASIRLAVFVTPILAAVASSTLLSRLVPAPHGTLDRVIWWVGLLCSSTAVLIVTDRASRRLLPLAALLKLSLVFPDRVPSRFSVALRSGTTKSLERRLQGSELDAPTRCGAEELLRLVGRLNQHDPFTRGHAERVRALTDLLAEQLDLDPEDRERARWAALLHDVGKLEVPRDILRKSGAPTAEEWAVIRTHPDAGMHLVRGPIADWLGEWTNAIGEHHEKFDGSGYPRGLAGDDIAYAARMVSVADVFDVITAVRSYKKPVTIQEARLELTRCAGSHFDPAMVRAFLQISLGDLRRAMGPISWLAQVSILGRLAAAPAASTVASGVMAITGLGVGPVIRAEPGITSSEPISIDRASVDGATNDTTSSTVSGATPGGPADDGSGLPPGEDPTTTTTTIDVTTTTTTILPTTTTLPDIDPILPPITVPPITVPPITVPPVTLPGLPSAAIPEAIDPFDFLQQGQDEP